MEEENLQVLTFEITIIRTAGLPCWDSRKTGQWKHLKIKNRTPASHCFICLLFVLKILYLKVWQVSALVFLHCIISSMTCFDIFLSLKHLFHWWIFLIMCRSVWRTVYCERMRGLGREGVRIGVRQMRRWIFFHDHAHQCPSLASPVINGSVW